MDVAVSVVDGVAAVKVSGSLNTNTAGELEGALQDVLGQVTGLVFDFTDLEYISSAGLRVLMMAFKRLGGQGVAVEGARPDVREVFDITGFSQLLEIR